MRSEHIIVQRIVVRRDLSHDMADKLLADIRTEVAYLDALQAPMPSLHNEVSTTDRHPPEGARRRRPAVCW